MNNHTKTYRIFLPMIALMIYSNTVKAQNWPQPESAYMPSTQSPQWVENKMQSQPMQRMPYGYQQRYQQPQYRAQPPMPYPPQNYGYAPYYPSQNYGYAPYYQPNNGWGNWPNRSNMMPSIPNMGNWSSPSMPNMGNWSTPNMDMGNWSTPEMPQMNNMPGMPNMDNFSMPSPSFEMPSPSFNTPTMNMPFFN